MASFLITRFAQFVILRLRSDIDKGVEILVQRRQVVKVRKDPLRPHTDGRARPSGT